MGGLRKRQWKRSARFAEYGQDECGRSALPAINHLAQTKRSQAVAQGKLCAKGRSTYSTTHGGKHGAIIRAAVIAAS
jgi:hypothetical protein